MMSTERDDPLLIEHHGPVGWLIFNRPDVGNAMDASMLGALEEAWRELDRELERRAGGEPGHRGDQSADRGGGHDGAGGVLARLSRRPPVGGPNQF